MSRRLGLARPWLLRESTELPLTWFVCVGWGVGVEGSTDDRGFFSFLYFCAPSSKVTKRLAIFRASLQTGSLETDYAARQTAYRAGIRGNPLILFPPEAHPALEPLRSLHDTPLRASLVAAKPPPWVPLPQHRSVRRLRLTFTRVERGCVMTTRHSRLSYTTLQFLYLLMHSTSLGNIHTVAVFFFSYIESNTLLMSERQSDWEVGGGKKKNKSTVHYL